jgi:hypothetical protein
VANYNEEELLQLQLLEQDNMYGIRLANLLKQFVSVENNNLQYLISSLGYNGSYIDDGFNKIDLTGIMTFSDDEIKSLENICVNAIFTDIDKSHYNSKESIITLANGTSLTTTAYSMTVTQNELDKIYKRLINQAIDNEIILSKFEQIDDKISEFGITNVDSIKEIYINRLKEWSDALEYKGTDNRQTTITVYVYDGVTVSTRIERQDIGKVSIDRDNTKTNTYDMVITKYTEQGTDTKEYSVGIENTQSGFTRNFEYKDDTNYINLNYEARQENEKIDISANMEYSNSQISKLQVDTVLEATMGNKQDITTKFSNTNNVVLNNYDGETVQKLIDTIKNKFIINLEKKQSTVNTKMLDDILNWVEEREKQKQSEEENNKEWQKRRFNNKFELYAGKKLTVEEIQKLLKVASKNTTGYTIVDGSKIKIAIQSGKTADEKMEKLNKALESSNNTFNVELEYSDDGYINAIYITIAK